MGRKKWEKSEAMKKSGGKVEKADLGGFEPVVDKTPLFLILVL